MSVGSTLSKARSGSLNGLLLLLLLSPLLGVYVCFSDTWLLTGSLDDNKCTVYNIDRVYREFTFG